MEVSFDFHTLSLSDLLQIPFRQPRVTAPAPVILCISPQFVAEQWQIFVTHAHIAHYFGGHLHLYVTSMLESYFNLVKEYEKLGYVTVDYWMRYKFKNKTFDSPEPNSNVEWRNQAGAHTDCLLQYKEVASFITFVDLDDVLVPRGFDSYYEEFSSLFYFHPNILTFQYPKREIMLHNKPTIDDINLVEQFCHPWFATTTDTGKIVARPVDLDSMWIHRSFYVPDKKFYVVNHNFLLHMQRPVDTNGQDPITYEMKAFSIFKNLKLNESVLEPVQNELEKHALYACLLLDCCEPGAGFCREEVASFITFVDLDDVLVPRGFDSYYEEFSSLFYFHPNILTFQYPKREIMLHNKPTIDDINLVEQFCHPWFATTTDTGKIVARPVDLDSMWIHRSFYVPDKKFYVVNHNFLLHMQRPVDTNGQDPITYEMKAFSIFKNLKLNESVLEPVQNELEKLLNSSSFQKVASKLPTHAYYFPIMFRCYYEKYYRSLDNTCPNGEGCLMTPITFHYHTNSRWSSDIGCYT
ncbi:hypothetical protein CRE_18770 [Caenorhabditis remanei]|uniref:Glycosyltransferase family 92 protein n=1 Tax=Caenorhabditis remanei TaxID=31234 RepID=E3LK45_CAERE|nr:hypothetical protein CRE_18770 [Caenorhabditis remanei]